MMIQGASLSLEERLYIIGKNIHSAISRQDTDKFIVHLHIIIAMPRREHSLIPEQCQRSARSSRVIQY